ncbi:hypothetical protein Pmani_020470 [Petrolisthes manimaculis]|uniref:Uncharacterized protein n=1 Tax=Petrolisthes manimaculis TaxID=1843537 RepID=A0AAE1U2J9_9EUCA|nr:hypothetical protein Pmani_020470 [Petrolisthes manimaculis]
MWVSPERVESGQEVEITCQSSSSVPPTTISWQSSSLTTSSLSTTTTTALHTAAPTTHTPSLYGGTVARSKLKLGVSGDDDGRILTCQADNGVLLSSPLTANLTLNVLHGPVWVWAPNGVLDVREGEDFTISALATANPGPVRYRWRHETRIVDDMDGSVESSGGSGQLVVEHISRHQSGNYTVTASTPNHHINATVIVNVQYGPEDLLAARRVTVDEDGAATVLCSATGNPTPNITWTRSHHNNNNNNKHDKHDRDDNNNNKKYDNKQDRYDDDNNNNNKYNHYDTNDNNNNNKYNRYDTNDNNNYNRYDDNNNNNYNNKHLGTLSSNTSSDVILASGFGEARLVVELASVSDTGLYLCHATSSIATPRPIATAIVVTQAPTSITEHGGDRVGQAWAPVGGTGLLDCRVKAAPAPTVTWTFNTNKLLVADGRKYIIHVPQLVDKVSEWSCVLEVRGVTVRDHGRYTCTAHNSRGSHSLTFSLTPPLLPATPWDVNVTSVGNSVALLSWRSNPFGAPPAGYTIRYRLVGHTQYKHVDVSGSNVTRWSVKKLTPGAQYTFAISAYNNRGSSNYTTPSPQLSIFSMVEEGAVSSSVGGGGGGGGRRQQQHHQRIPRLIILLICLTATTLLVLNVSIVVCFLRRRAATKRNMSASSSKTTALEVYTPTSAAPVDEFPLTTVSDGPPPEYQEEYYESASEGSEDDDGGGGGSEDDDGGGEGGSEDDDGGDSEDVIFFCDGETEFNNDNDNIGGHIIPTLIEQGLLYVAGFDIVLPTHVVVDGDGVDGDGVDGDSCLHTSSKMSLERQTRMEESEHTCLISPCSASHTPEPLASVSSPASRSGSPLLLNGGVTMQSDHLYLPDTNTNTLYLSDNTTNTNTNTDTLYLPDTNTDTLYLPDNTTNTNTNTNTNYNTNTNTRLNSDNNNAVGVVPCSASVPLLMRRKVCQRSPTTDGIAYPSLNNPDVCPTNNNTNTNTNTSLGSCDPLLQQQQQEQDNYPYIDVDQVSVSSQHSSELYGFTLTTKSDEGVRSTQQGVRNTQQGVRNTQQGILNTQQGVLNTQQGVRNTQQGILNTQHGMTNTQQGVLNTQQGVLNTPQAQRFANQPRTRSGLGCTRHNSISGYIGYRSPIRPDHMESTQVQPDLCKVTPTNTKRVGWKEVLHESSELGPQSSQSSQVGSQTFQSPVLEAQTFRGSDLGYQVSQGSETGYQASQGSESGYQASRGSDLGYQASRGTETGYKISRGSESGYQAVSQGSGTGYQVSRGSETGYKISQGSGTGYQVSQGSELDTVTYHNTEVGHEASRGSTDTSTSSTTSTLTLGPRPPPPPPPPRCVRQHSSRSNTSQQLYNIQDKR